MKKSLLSKVDWTTIVQILGKIVGVFVLVFSFMTSNNAYSKELQNQSITIKAKQISIQDLFDRIEKETDYRFVYSIDDFDIKRKVDVNVEDIEIISLLNQIIPNDNLIFKRFKSQIIIRKKTAQENRPDSSINLIQQQKNVKGVVKDEENFLLPGVNVIVKGSSRGTVTNMDGEFNIRTMPSDTLVFSFIGYKEQQILVGTKSQFDVKMKIGSQLSEVIITSSYGTKVKKENEVSSSYTVEAEQLKSLPQQRIDKMLDGIVPGLQYNPQSQSASSTRSRYSVTIRGEASLGASNEPLWIIDGTRMHTGGKTNMITGLSTSVSPLSYINPQDIESIRVLKDAAATSIYGADGANGVILITTKRGSSGKLQFDVSLRRGQSLINDATRFKVLDGNQYLDLARESFENAGNDMRYFPFTDNESNQYSTTNTDWYDTFYDIGSNSLLNISAKGGNEKGTYYISGSYFNDESTVVGNDTQRFALRTRNTAQITSKMDIDLSLSASYNLNQIFNPGSDYYENLPIISPYNPDGTFRQYYSVIEGSNPDGSPKWVDKRFYNSLAEREQNDNNQKAFAFQGNFKFSYTPIEALKYTGQFGVDYQSNTEEIYRSIKNWSGKDANGNPLGEAYSNQSNFLNWTMIHRLNFQKQLNKHHISGVVGFEMNSSENNFTGARGTGFVNDYLRRVSLAEDRFGSGNYYERNSLSYLAQMSYNYNDRYNASLSFRRDGNSNFGKNVRWAEFASAGVSWNIHNEDFFESEIVNFLKLKASYGSNGNSRIGSQESNGVYDIGDSYYYNGKPGATMTTPANPNLSWETTYMANLGLDLGLFNQRINLALEGYRNKTVDLLSQLDVSRTIGALKIFRNVGSIENKGLEATIRTQNIITDQFQWNTTLIASRNENKILELYNNIPKNNNTTRWEEGADINTFYLIRWAGVDPRDGYPLWYDTEGNVTRQYSANNRVKYKSSTPEVYGSLRNTFKYKDFSLSIQASYTIGGYSFSPFGRDVNSDGLNIMDGNQSIDQLNRWQRPGDVVSIPQLMWGVSTRSTMNSTRYLFNKTNIRLQNVALNYFFPDKITQELGVQQFGLSLIGDNLGLWTPYDNNNKNSYRNNMSGYPLETMISLGANIQF
ncbi:SusC/RagA family TonB-linked outer membrane protein [Zunongwangia sp. HGR-M22]|uniref:SusC/RagA family TonB-linked outer membrane protein n=1 Tax=Zunongwangia sp. HGR-M22 TaxID=3015168 RepID=UPI0022DE3608|nr:SusC/RagA family TonB-linked outer membrane protein [Zunongwangia sp. HGR-M22]WBL26718.1 SusC/RagA family TonB-linked outer membrane protein [Zunongwangia sp. HGR-M22]